MEIRDTFDLVVCINLDSRRDRWDRLQTEQATQGWPFRPIEWQLAIDGSRVAPPAWMEVGDAPEAWGRLCSHLRICERVLNEDFDSVLVVEDHAAWRPDFGEAAELFVSSLPADWELVFFGGEHAPNTTPRRLNEHVYRPEEVRRSHCYGYKRRFASQLYEEIVRYNEPDRFKEPADYHYTRQLGRLCARPDVSSYCPAHWLVGMRPNDGDPEYFNAGNPIARGFFAEL